MLTSITAAVLADLAATNRLLPAARCGLSGTRDATASLPPLPYHLARTPSA